MAGQFEETIQMTAFKLDAVAPRVLIVDNDPLICESLQALIAQAGYEARSVGSGAAALAALRKGFAPIVITDRDMPDMDGLTLCRTIRHEQFDSYVYVILLTVQDSEPAILEGLDAGADDYLSKKVSKAQIIARLRTARRILGLEQTLRTTIEEKARLATTDTLTGAHNRRFLMRNLAREMKQAKRGGTSVALLMLDIDHFKQVNDRFGHAVGDEVLKEFSARATDCLVHRKDWLARYGGEEFIAVLPDTNMEGAYVVAEKLRRTIGNTSMRTSRGPLDVTVSIGAGSTEALPSGEAEDVDKLLAVADECLYRSKEEGRNRTTLPVAWGVSR
jgi:two-component system cell cycle response regulator